jgi:hypothetical protein
VKRIELDQYQKSSFQAMVMKLFPEYKYFEWHQSDTFWLYNRKGLNSDLVWFHWYEFLMTQLMKKLFDYSVMHYYDCNGYFMLEHPVDYFYKQFKTLK